MYPPLIISGIAGFILAVLFLLFVLSKRVATMTKFITIIVIMLVVFYGLITWGSLSQDDSLLFEESLFGLISGGILGALTIIVWRSRDKGCICLTNCNSPLIV